MMCIGADRFLLNISAKKGQRRWSEVVSGGRWGDDASIHAERAAEIGGNLGSSMGARTAVAPAQSQISYHANHNRRLSQLKSIIIRPSVTPPTPDPTPISDRNPAITNPTHSHISEYITQTPEPINSIQFPSTPTNLYTQTERTPLVPTHSTKTNPIPPVPAAPLLPSLPKCSHDHLVPGATDSSIPITGGTRQQYRWNRRGAGQGPPPPPPSTAVPSAVLPSPTETSATNANIAALAVAPSMTASSSRMPRPLEEPNTVQADTDRADQQGSHLLTRGDLLPGRPDDVVQTVAEASGFYRRWSQVHTDEGLTCQGPHHGATSPEETRVSL